MNDPSISEIAAEALKALGDVVSKEFDKFFSTKYVGDTYYDEPRSIFDDSGLDVKKEPIKETMRNKSFYPTDHEIDALVGKFKEYAKKIDDYDKKEVRVFNQVNAVVDDIRKHIDKHGGTVFIDDDHENSYFGYSCRKTNTQWQIPHKTVLEYLTDNTPDILDVEYLNTGKRAINDKRWREILSEYEEEEKEKPKVERSSRLDSARSRTGFPIECAAIIAWRFVEVL